MARNDGRALDQIRPVRITTDYIKFAEGSCLIELGQTRVICTASVEETVPPFLKGSGSGWVTAEYGMLPRSCQSRVPRGKDSGRTHEIQRLVGRSLRSIIELKGFGERTIWIDCDVLQADGGTRTASLTGSFIALALALEKIRKAGLIRAIPLKDTVAATSVGMFNGDALLDLCYEEDSKAEVDMNVVMTGSEKFIEIQGTAERRPFDREQMDKMLSFAKKGVAELTAIQKKTLGGII